MNYKRCTREPRAFSFLFFFFIKERTPSYSPFPVWPLCESQQQLEKSSASVRQSPSMYCTSIYRPPSQETGDLPTHIHTVTGLENTQPPPTCKSAAARFHFAVLSEGFLLFASFLCHLNHHLNAPLPPPLNVDRFSVFPPLKYSNKQEQINVLRRNPQGNCLRAGAVMERRAPTSTCSERR